MNEDQECICGYDVRVQIARREKLCPECGRHIDKIRYWKSIFWYSLAGYVVISIIVEAMIIDLILAFAMPPPQYLLIIVHFVGTGFWAIILFVALCRLIKEIWMVALITFCYAGSLFAISVVLAIAFAEYLF